MSSRWRRGHGKPLPDPARRAGAGASSRVLTEEETVHLEEGRIRKEVVGGFSSGFPPEISFLSLSPRP